MKSKHRGHQALILCCCLFLWAAALPSYAAIDPPVVAETVSPEPATPIAERPQDHDRMLERLLTPQAEIQIGPGTADTERLMRRSHNSSLSYVIRSLWNGIVEYVFPEHGLFRRGASLARVYDPSLLEDLQRAREYAESADVSPLTIAAAPRRTTVEEPPAAGGGAEASAPAPQPIVSAPEVAAPPSPDAVISPPEHIDFDFDANQRQQDQLREQAELTAAVVAGAIDNLHGAKETLDQANVELKDRRRLFEQGVLAREALGPPEERLAKARAAEERARSELAEAQEGYERLAARIERLEREAVEAHEAIRKAREARARQAEIAERRRQQAQAREAAQAAPREVSEAEETARPTLELREDEATEDEEGLPAGTRITREMRELAAPRWEELDAEAPGLISEVLAPQGTLVEAGDELLRVANLQLAQLAARINPAQLGSFRVGRSVTITFEDYPDVVFDGWIASISPCATSDEVEVGLLVVCESGRFADDPYLALRWMTLEAGVGADTVGSQALDPVMKRASTAEMDLRLQQMFPMIGPGALYSERVTAARVPSDDRFTGRLRLRPVERFICDGGQGDEHAMRLAALADWRRTYVDGMTTSILDDGTCVTYPAQGNAGDAIRAMLRGQVSHRPNLCAATMREALGWGLGDAHRWATHLPRMGYVAREDRLPRPGDILVWPFTYGPNRTQHIGFAVRQGRKLMMLSNLSGHLGTTEILDGYIAFYRPDDEPAN